ncbi:MAG: DUF3343 domain-containing protein [Spirochaetaceae bacterium]|nr:DUF3343 domain-containing protein [Spirochaetaceae bacterium]
MKFIITFNDISGSLRTERVLKKLSYPCVLDAAPRGLGASCVYIIRTEAQKRDDVEAVLKNSQIIWDRIIEEPEAAAFSC